MSSMHIGRRWYKFDFHTHTPVTSDYKQPAETEAEWYMPRLLGCEIDAEVTCTTESVENIIGNVAAADEKVIPAHINGPKGLLQAIANTIRKLKAS